MLQIETLPEAYVAILYACMAVDEHVSEDETDELIRTLVKSDLFDEVDVVSVYKKVQLINQANRFNAFKLIELAAPRVHESFKPVVCRTAEQLLGVDGTMQTEEHNLLQHLKKCLWPE